jgi:hypothetical protein
MTQLVLESAEVTALSVGYGHGLLAPVAVIVERDVLAEALGTLRTHTGVVEFHLGAVAEIATQATSEPSSDELRLWVNPAHAEAVVGLVWIAQTAILITCAGTTRRERRKNATPAQRVQLRRLTKLRNQMLELSFTMTNGGLFSLDAGMGQDEGEGV